MAFNYAISIDTIILAITAVVSLGMLFIAYRGIREQIQNAVGSKEDVFKARRLEQLKIAVSIEEQIDKTSSKLSEFSWLIATSEEKNDNDKFYLTDLIERYLYAIDTLCYAINKNYLDNEDDWRNKYNDRIRETVQTYEQYYGETSPYKNTKDIYRKWNNS
ncbi:MAG: hypothetical protein FWE23_01390 [Chitinivibrionia bacterium]|nr:hypothetical protein [Chitinivibrionia bacterium]